MKTILYAILCCVILFYGITIMINNKTPKEQVTYSQAKEVIPFNEHHTTICKGDYTKGFDCETDTIETIQPKETL